jgi:CHAD domain-containing protein
LFPKYFLFTDMGKTAQEYGRAVLGYRVDAFFKELADLVSGMTDEAVHQTRVESRRMRAALEAFREMFPVRSFNSVYREVRRVTRILGRPRESAVCVALIRELEETRAAEPFCLEFLRKRFASKLKKEERQLHKRLERIDTQQLRSRIDSLISSINADEVRSSNPSQPSLFPMNESAVENSIRVLTGLAVPVHEYLAMRKFDLTSDEEIHSLRIAAKKIRYAMEIYSSIWPGGLSDRIKRARKFQQAAGKYNDWSVLCGRFEKEVQRLESAESVNLAYEIGKLSVHVGMRKRELKTKMRSALIEFKKSLRGISGANKLRPRSDLSALIPAVRRSQRKKSSNGKTARQGAASA